MFNKTRKTLIVFGTCAALAAAPLALSGCYQTEEQKAASSESHESHETSAKTEADNVSYVEPWAKATPEGKKMTGVFGTLENKSDKDITLVGAKSPAAGMIELHEVVDGKMQEHAGGFVIPAGGSFELKPGGYHIMFMKMSAPILAGEKTSLTLEFSDGSTKEVSDILVKDISGGQEEYVSKNGHEGHDHDSHEGHDHAEHEGEGH